MWSRSVGLASAEDDAARAELGSVRLVGRAAEHVYHAARLNARKPGYLDDLQILLDEECPGNSASPKVDICPRMLRYRLLHHDVGDLQPASRLENPMQLSIDR